MDLEGWKQVWHGVIHKAESSQCVLLFYTRIKKRDVHTSRNTQQASEMEPATPDSASWAVNGIASNMILSIAITAPE